jgi:hypothetical protein
VRNRPKKKEKLPIHERVETDVEWWIDPEWGPALDALEGWADGYTGKSDPKPLAALLCSGTPVPAEVAWRLARIMEGAKLSWRDRSVQVRPR